MKCFSRNPTGLKNRSYRTRLKGGRNGCFKKTARERFGPGKIPIRNDQLRAGTDRKNVCRPVSCRTMLNGAECNIGVCTERSRTTTRDKRFNPVRNRFFSPFFFNRSRFIGNEPFAREKLTGLLRFFSTRFSPLHTLTTPPPPRHRHGPELYKCPARGGGRGVPRGRHDYGGTRHRSAPAETPRSAAAAAGILSLFARRTAKNGAEN